MALGAGSIAFVGYNADGSTASSDNIAFVALSDIPAGEVIVFEDNEWNGTAFADANEGAFSWTATSAVAAGTIVRIDNIEFGAISASTGSVSFPVAGRGPNRGFNATNETVYAYQGSAAAPVFLTAIANGGFSAGNGLLSNTGLTAGVNALDLSTLDSGADIAAFNGARSGASSFDDYRIAINTASNWISQDSSGDQSNDGTAPDVPFSSQPFTITSSDGGITISSLTVDAASKSEGESFTFSVTLSEAVPVDTTIAIAVAGATGDIAGVPASVTIAAGQSAASFTVATVEDAVAEADEALTVTATLGTSSQQATATILNDDGANITLISAVQGTGLSSSRVGQTVTVEAIVVGDFQDGDTDGARNLGGFWLQEEATDSDGNALTSEGIFVSYASLGVDVKIGDKVSVTGVVAENFGNTELNASSVTVVQAGAVADVNTMAAAIDLPSVGVQTASNGTYVADLEAYEGMLVRFTETLTITEQFNLDQFGEMLLTQGERPNSYTVDHDASVSGYDAHIRDIASRSIVFDDGRSSSNPNLDNTVVDGDYNASTAPRMGDTITGLTGVLDYDFNEFRVHAIENGPGINDVVSENPRPESFPDVGGTLKIASFNVLNYFTTLDNGQSTANGFEPRGAETQAEFDRQTAKLVNSILQLDADVLGLMELENNFIEGSDGNAIQYLVDQLNEVSGSFHYDWVRPGQDFVGGDAIAVGFIYDVTSVRVSFDSEVAILDDSDVSAELLGQSTLGHIFNGENTSRAAVAVTFEELATGGEFTAVVNHFKSKGGSGTAEDADVKDGNGGWNHQRELAAKALVEWLGTDPTGSHDQDVLILGDLNAYEKEDPIDVLVEAGFTDQGAGSYGYVFDGQTGSLDHVMTNESLSAQVTGAADWHINADEADAVDYQLNFNGDLSTNERDPSIFDAELIARVSDHDPIVIGLDLTEEPVSTPAFTLQLLHLSDGEAGLLAGSTAKNLAALVDAFDDDYANTLILSGGDTYLPGPFLAAGTDPSVIATLNAVTGSTLAATAAVPIGAVDTAIHNVLGVEVSAIGNHEWDLGSTAFAGSFIAGGGWVGANYALVSANLDVSGDSAIRNAADKTLGGNAANDFIFDDASTLKGKIAPAVVVEKGGERIGIVGATTQILESISSPTGTEIKGFPNGPGANGEVDDMALLAAQLQPIIDEMRADGINKIILQSHLQNIANEKLLATLLKGVDIILAAGSNTRLGDADDEAHAFPGHDADFAGTYPLVIEDAEGGNTLIVNTDNEYTYLGRLKVDFDADGNILVDNLVQDASINGAYAATEENVAEAWDTTVEDLDDTAFAQGTKGDLVRDLTDAVGNVISIKDGNVFGYTDVYLEGERAFVRSEETNLGSLSADANAHALREALGASEDAIIVSFKNGGGIRAQIGTLSAPDPVDGSVDKLPPPANPDAGKAEGGVSQLDIENSLRFDNKLMAFDTNAAGIKALLEHGVAAGTLQGRFPQIGGISFSWDPDLPAGSRVLDVALVDGLGRSYALYDDGVLQSGVPTAITVITLNFLANGGDGYPSKANGSNFRYLFDDGSLSAAVDEALDFTNPAVIAANTPAGKALLGEQQALAEYMQAHHATRETAFDVADTSAEFDERIQNLNYREDTVLEDVEELPVGTEGDDVLVGMSWSEIILAGGGDDLVSGGAGNDVIDGAEGDDELSGDEGDDVLKGGAGDDALFGGAGNDVLQGGAGDDSLDGGEGIDTADYSGDTAGIVVDLANGSAEGDAIGSDALTAIETVIGGAGNDILIGDAGDNVFVGGLGNDVIDGGAGFDTLDLSGATGPVTVDFARGLVSGAGIGTDSFSHIEAFRFGAGDDAVSGGNGNETFDGGAGNDTLKGGAGNDTLTAGEGNDNLDGGSGDDVVDGGAGNDTIKAGSGIDTIDAGAGDDVIDAGSGNDVILAGAGNDVVDAGSGDDRIAGGAGDDVLTGGSGHDAFVFAAGFGKDVISDFKTTGSSSDVLEFSSEVFADAAAALEAADQVGSDVVFTIDVNTTLTLKNVQLASLNDFHFV
ncbi:ExeM/NucH family extracellular endonuclease [Bosea thiooxidans]